MKNRQDCIPFGSSAPIVLAPYETVPIGGAPTIQVMDPDLYIRVRDILLARQLSGSPDIGSNRSLVWPELISGPAAEILAQQESQEASGEVKEVETSELERCVDQMLGALATNDLIQASATLIKVIGYIGGERQELKAIVGISARILGNCRKRTQD
jgi:hypothetical protein